MLRTLSREQWTEAGIAFWVLAVSAGMFMLWNYKSTPGDSGEPPREWPSESQTPHSATRPTLLMVAHPKCPCTAASLDELAVLMDSVRDQVSARVLFVRPSGATEDFLRGELWDRASRIAGVVVQEDTNGTEAARFGAHVSGHTLIYDTKGRLIFSGGITGSRGHSGDNFGRQRMLSLLSGRPVDRSTSPVFGCSLDEPRGRPD